MQVEENINLVKYMCKKLYPKFRARIEFEDFEQILSLALVQASKKFKPELGFEFSTLACRTMEYEVLKYLRHDGLSVAKLHDKPKSHNIGTFTEIFSKNNGQDPDLDYIQGLMSKVNDFMKIEQRIDLKNALDKLSENHRKIIFEQFYNEKSQVQIANECGISQIEVSRRKTKALKQLRELLSA